MGATGVGLPTGATGVGVGLAASGLAGSGVTSLPPVSFLLPASLAGSALPFLPCPGAYTGLFKHLFDLVDQEALRGKPVLMVATGGSPLHGLVTEHQLRPLLSFFGAHTVPTAVYATAQDFTDLTVSSAGTRARLERAAAETVRLAALPRGDRGTDSGDGGHGRAAMAAA